MSAFDVGPRDAQVRSASLRRLEQLVRSETPSGDVAALEQFAALLEAPWTALGATVSRRSTCVGPVLTADFPGRGWGTERAPVLLITHADTVWPRGTIDGRVPWRREAGVVAGPGVYDMKAGIVIIESAVRLLESSGHPHPPLRIHVAPDEETGSRHSTAALRAAAEGCAAALGFESPHPDGTLKIGRFGSTRIRLTVTGRAAHAALDAHSGVSAIDELVDQLLVLRSLVAPFSEGDQPVLLNVGGIEAPGKTNVVSPEAAAEIGLRFARQEQEDALLPAIRSLQPVRTGAVIDVAILSHRPAWAMTERDSALGRSLQPHFRTGPPARGSADTNMLADMDMPLIDGLGAVGAGAHAVHEHVIEESMWDRIRSLCEVLTDERTWAGVGRGAAALFDS